MLGSEKKLVWVRLDVRKKLGLVRFEKKVGQVGQVRENVRFGKKDQVGLGQVGKKVKLGSVKKV